MSAVIGYLEMSTIKENTKKPTAAVSLSIMAALSLVFFFGMRSGLSTISLLLVNIGILLAASLFQGIGVVDIEAAMREGLCQVSSAILILIIVGALISTWIQSGIVPMIIFYGLKYVDPEAIIPATFLLCTVMSICTGSSWATCGTVGIACASIGVSLNIPVYVVAGAAIAGATVGDKISPFSDTTIVAAGIAGCDIYDHIKMMLYTTIPSFILSCAIFVLIGLRYSPSEVNSDMISSLEQTLTAQYKFSPFLLLIPTAVVVMAIKKVPATISLLLATVLGAAAAIFYQGCSLKSVLDAVYSGNSISTGMEIADTMLNKGGIITMLPVIAIIILCIFMSGIIRKMGLLDAPVEYLRTHIRSDKGLVLLTLLCGIMLVVFLSSLYVAGILVGEFFRALYKERGVKLSVLSRSIEESTTITTPLIPWHSSYNYYSTLFGLTGMQFVPYAVFCWLNLLVSILMTSFGICAKAMKESGDP